MAFATEYGILVCGLDSVFALSIPGLRREPSSLYTFLEMNLHKYTIDQLRKAVEDSLSYRQALIKLGVAPYGGNYQVIKKAVTKYEVDTSHFKGQGIHRGVSLGPKLPIEVYLRNEVYITSFRLKNRLLSEGWLERICSNCDLTEWLGNPIPLELDHVSGDSSDNSLENLRLLCPNCHALTDTYRGKNVGRLSSALPD